MNSPPEKHRPIWEINLSFAFYFLFGAIMWEFVFNRLAWNIGAFRRIGSDGALANLAISGRYAMAFVGILSTVLACAGLPRLVGNSRLGPLPFRVVLLLVSPFYLPVICVTVFRPVSLELILYAYLAVVGSATVLALMVVTQRIDSSRRRLLIALAAMELIGAIAYLFSDFGGSNEVVKNAFLLAEVLFVVTPIFAFLILAPRPLGAFARRPHTLGLFFACMVTCAAGFIVFIMPNEGVLQTVAHRSLDIRVPVSAGIAVYILALFLGSLLIGTLLLPSRRWKPTTHSRRIGIGLLGIWSSGIQPVRPYQFALVFVGFLYLCLGLLGELMETHSETELEPANPE